MNSGFSGEILYFLQYGFIQRAFVAGTFVAVTCSILGAFLVLRRMSLLGDGLSHVSLVAVALGLFAGMTPLIVAVPIVTAGSLLILALSKKTKVYGDAAIGIVSAASVALAVLLASLSGGFNADFLGFLFGNILAISRPEALFSISLSVIVLVLLALFRWDLFSATFDEEYAKTTGIRTELLDGLLAVLTALTVMLSLKVVGSMLVSALLILPAVSALQLARSFGATLVLSGLCGAVCVLIGISLSFFLDIPAGAAIVLLLVGCFGGAFFLGKLRG